MFRFKLLLAISSMLLGLSSALSWPFDLFNYGEMRNPVLTLKVNETTISLDDIPPVALQKLCQPNDGTFENATYSRTQFVMSYLQQTWSIFSESSSLSMLNQALQDTSAPQQLFQSVSIQGDWYDASRGLAKIERCPTLLDNVQTFKFDVFTEFGPGPAPSTDIPTRLTNVLWQMDRLETLTLVLPEYHTDVFAEDLAEAELSLDRVKTLVLGSYNDFAVKHCPNVETVSSNGWVFLHSRRGRQNTHRGKHAARLVEAAARAPNLTCFEMNDWWSVARLEQVLQEMPDIPRLGMPGGVYEDSVEEMYPVLAKFEKLEELVLADASGLGVGFDPPGCGNVYMGPGGEEYAAQVAEEGHQAADRVARAVFNSCKALRKLWIGDHSYAVAEKDVLGRIVELNWVYEDRESPSGWVV